jgi:hypothetical protein
MVTGRLHVPATHAVPELGQHTLYASHDCPSDLHGQPLQPFVVDMTWFSQLTQLCALPVRCPFSIVQVQLQELIQPALRQAFKDPGMVPSHPCMSMFMSHLVLWFTAVQAKIS